MKMGMLRVVDNEPSMQPDPIVGEILDAVANIQLRVDEVVVIRKAFVRDAIARAPDAATATEMRAFARVLDANGSELSALVKLLLARLERLT